MQNLTAGVGEGGRNTIHDTALVQAMLVLTRRPVALDPRQPAYLETIDGKCNDPTKRAIEQFQTDLVFVDAAGLACKMVAGATQGVIDPNDVSWKRLVASVPPTFADLRVLPGSKTVYIAARTATLNASLTRIAAESFHPAFRANVTTLVNNIFDSYAIAITLCADGARRTFATQYALLMSPRGVTHAGPGESNHNFGQAADLGFAGLRWLKPDGTPVVNEDSWMHTLDPRQLASGESLFFWNMLRTMGTQIGLHRGPESDRPHLQAWDDAGIDMASRLAALMTRVGPMRWSGARQKYRCDLGFGGQLYDVGKAKDIWIGHATLTTTVLTQARPRVVALAASGAATLAAQHGASAPPAAGQAAPPATPHDVQEMRARLQAEFVRADASWESWTP